MARYALTKFTEYFQSIFMSSKSLCLNAPVALHYSAFINLM